MLLIFLILFTYLSQTLGPYHMD